MSIRTTKKHTASFTAFDDRKNAYRLHVYTMFRTFDGSDGSTTVPVMGDITTHDGQPVLRLEKGKYELVISRKILTSDDPNAP